MSTKLTSDARTATAPAVASGVLLAANRKTHNRRLEILQSLSRYCDRYPKGATPRDLGAWDASHHSNDLKAMSKLGLVEICPRYMGVTGMLGYSGSNRYKITDKGRAFAANNLFETFYLHSSQK